MSRIYASIVILVALAAVLLPVRENWRDQPVDSFPLSYYPMFSHEHPETQDFTYMVGVDMDGGVHHIQYYYAGAGGLNQVRKQLRRIASRGPESSAVLCERVAERLREHEPELHARLRSISLVTGAFRPYDYFAQDARDPASLAVHATHRIRGPDPALEAFPAWLSRQVRAIEWQRHQAPVPGTSPNREILERSLELGRRFLLANQREAGNFNYQYDFVSKRFDESDSSVRQAGTLWSLSLIHAHLAAAGSDDEERRDARRETLYAVHRGLAFFMQYTRLGPIEGSLLIAYPGEDESRTGTVALVALALIDLLRVEPGPDANPANLIDRNRLEATLDGYLLHLLGMWLPNRHFSSGLQLADGKRVEDFSPYYDGETLLALVKAAKYLGKRNLIPVIEASALPLAKYYTADQWATDRDSNETKGFFQWSCMAFQEYADAGWKDADALGDYVLALGWWMIHVHHTLMRNLNTGYAYEGIIQAYRIARQRGLTEALHDLRWTIDRGLFKLTTWQVGGPLMNFSLFLSANPTTDPLAVGGILNSANRPLLRIDVTQHQMHAVLLALEHVYVDEAPR